MDPAPIKCSECGGTFPVTVAALKSLRAVCAGCAASLAAVGEGMFAEEARIGRQIDLFHVALELDERNGWNVLDTHDESEWTLEGLARSVVGFLPPTAGGIAAATELVAETARRVAPRLLSEVGLEASIADLKLRYAAWLAIPAKAKPRPTRSRPSDR